MSSVPAWTISRLVSRIARRSRSGNAELTARGIAYTPIAETSIGSVIVFRDPDNIQLEFWLPAN